MNINFSTFKPLVFKGDFIYNNRYFPNKQDSTHDVIRAHLEQQFGDYFYYSDQLEKEKFQPISDVIEIKSSKKPKNKVKVDEQALKNLKIHAFKIRRENELYSGAELSYEVEKLKKMKKAGIKSILCLVPMKEYEKSAQEAGLNYKSLKKLSGAALDIFDINGDMVQDLIKNPTSWAKDESKIIALKNFIKTLDGENPELPPPLYFGCHNGTDRTFLWYQLYNILKDEPQDEPLSQEAVEKLAEFAQRADEHFRW